MPVTNIEQSLEMYDKFILGHSLNTIALNHGFTVDTILRHLNRANQHLAIIKEKEEAKLKVECTETSIYEINMPEPDFMRDAPTHFVEPFILSEL